MISRPFLRSKSERSYRATRAPLSARVPAIDAPIRPAPTTAKSYFPFSDDMCTAGGRQPAAEILILGKRASGDGTEAASCV